ncbi:MAG: hypothetical protein LBL74_04525 [Bacteroidales bacterium]|jgi:hypothetical protein|nr:hypothetical protein [Bacteroidales bacterium]
MKKERKSKMKVIKINNNIIILFVVLFIFNKGQAQINNLPIQEQWEIGIKDTILSEQLSNAFIIYNFIGDSTYRIIWGNEDVINYSNKKFNVLGNGVLKVIANDTNIILLEQGCGTSCNFYVVLPIKSQMKETLYNNVIAYDIKKNLIAYIYYCDNYQNICVRIENYITKTHIDIYEKNICENVVEMSCIKDVYFEDDYLMIIWEFNKTDKINLKSL